MYHSITTLQNQKHGKIIQALQINLNQGKEI